MELRHLRYFVAVADELSFTRAAEKLRVAQPSLSRQVKNLEDELGVRLFERKRNLVVLTDEGKSFLQDARRVIEMSAQSVKAVQQLSRGESQQLNIGYLFGFNFDLFPSAMAAFSLKCPSVSVNVFDMSPGEQLRALAARKIDLGLVGIRPPDLSAKVAGLSWACVASHKIVVALPEKHPLTAKAKLKLTDLKSLFFVGMSEESHPGSMAFFAALCQKEGFTPRILQDVALESGMMTFIAEGLGVTLAREQIQNLPHPGVVFRPLLVAEKADYWIAWSSDNKSPCLQKYIEVIKKQAAGSLIPI